LGWGGLGGKAGMGPEGEDRGGAGVCYFAWFVVGFLLLPSAYR